MIKLVILFLTILTQCNCQVESNFDLDNDMKDEFLKVGAELKAKVDEVLKQLKDKPKQNIGQRIARLENDNSNLANLLFLLKQAQSKENIKQIENKLKELQTKIQTELDEINKLPDATTIQPVTQSTRTIATSPTKATQNPSTLTVRTSETEGKTIETTVKPVSTTYIPTTHKQNDCNENQELLSNASELQDKTQKYIQTLTDSHRIAEAVNLIADEKRLEQMIEDLKIYFKEIDNIKTDLSNLRSKINSEIK